MHAANMARRVRESDEAESSRRLVDFAQVHGATGGGEPPALTLRLEGHCAQSVRDVQAAPERTSNVLTTVENQASRDG
jgi:hypothetical protein